MIHIIKKVFAADVPTMEEQLADVSSATGLATADFATVVGTLLNGLLGILGTAFLLLTIYAGFLWMTAAGNEEKVDKAQKIIRASVIGLLIVVLSYAITKFVFNTLIQAGL